MTRFWPNAESNLQQEINSKNLESTLLKLNCDKSLQILGWQAILSFEETVRMTGEWYQAFYSQESSSVAENTSRQIGEYTEMATQSNLAWTQ
jgi:CDP-glucose 4,6-dehydratase